VNFLDFDGSPNKTSNFFSFFEGESEAQANENKKTSAFNFRWEDVVKETEFRAKDLSLKGKRRTLVKAANISPEQRQNANSLRMDINFKHLIR